MSLDRDIDNMQARDWKIDISKISNVNLKDSSRSSLFDAVKLVVFKQVTILKEDAKSSKIKFIVDMLLERIRAAIEKTGFVDTIEKHFQKFDESEIIQKIEEKLPLKETYQKTYAELSQAIVDSILTEVEFKFEIESSSLKQKPIENQTNSSSFSKVDPSGESKSSIKMFDPSKMLESLNKQLKLISAFSTSGMSLAKSFSNDEKKTIVDIAEVVDASLLASIEYKIDNAIKSLDYSLNLVEKIVQVSTKIISPFSTSTQTASTKDSSKNKKKNATSFLPYQQFVLDNVLDKQRNIEKLACTGFDSILPQDRLDRISGYLSEILKKVSKKESFFEKIINFFKKKLFFKALIDPLKNIMSSLAMPFLMKFFSAISKTVEKITKFVVDVKDRLIAFGNLLLDFFKLVGKSLKFAVKKAFQAFKSLFSATMKGFKAIFNFVKPLFSGLKSILKASLDGIRRGLAWGFGKLKNSKFVKHIGEKLRKFTSKAKNLAAKVLRPLKTLGKFIAKPFQFVGNLFKGISSGISRIKQFGKNIVKSIANLGKNIKKAIVGKMKSLGKRIVGFAKKAMKKILGKFAGQLKSIGSKFIAKMMKSRVKKIVSKILARFVVGQAVGSSFPGVGNLIMLLISTYMTVKDCIEIFNDIKDFLDKNPEVANAIKDGISEVISKAHDFFDAICSFGKKLFNKIFVEGPKKLAKAFTHALNFISNPFSARDLSNARNAQEAELISIRDEEFAKLAKMPNEERIKLLDKLLVENEAKIEDLRAKAIDLTKKISEEEDRWWPSSKKILQLTTQRHELFKQMARFAAQAGLSDFTKQAFKDARDTQKNAELRKAKILARKEKMQAIEEMSARYKNKSIDLEALANLCKEQVKKLGDFKNSVQDFNDELASKAQNYIFQLKKLAMPQKAL